MANVEPINIFKFKGQGPLYVISLGHGSVHWFAMVIYVLLPYVRTDLGLSFTQAGTLVALIHISSALCNLASGLVIDMTGRRALFQVLSVALGGASLVVFGLTSSYFILAAMVACMGIANNFWHPAAIAFLTAQYPRNRGYVLSIHALFANLGDALAPLVAGALLGLLTWQNTAVTSALPVFLVCAMLAVLILPRDRPEQGETKRGMGFQEYLAGLTLMIKNKAIMGLCLMAAFRTAAQVGLFTFLPLYFVEILKTSPVVMGAGMMAMQVTGMIIAPIAGAGADRIGERPIAMMGLTGTTVIIAGLTFISNELVYISAIAVLGLFLYALRPVLQSWLMGLVPERMGGSATSLMFGIQAVLGALMPIVGGAVADAYGLIVVFYLIAAVMLISNLIIFVLPKTGPAPAHP